MKAQGRAETRLVQETRKLRFSKQGDLAFQRLKPRLHLGGLFTQIQQMLPPAFQEFVQRLVSIRTAVSGMESILSWPGGVARPARR